jgi:hypothetical protein
MPLKEQSVKKQAISKFYFSIASIKSSKESSNYNKIVCFAGVNDTGQAPEKSNISANIRKKSNSSLGLPTGAKRSCLKKKNRGEKSGGTVPLRDSSARFFALGFFHGSTLYGRQILRLKGFSFLFRFREIIRIF